MITLTYRASAVADLARIARETRAAWGQEQAARYTSELRDKIKSLREFPLRFPEFHPRPGMRRINSGRHAVFYVVAEGSVEVVRILHAAGDLERLI